MYCPKCKSEFREGFDYCEKCECSLIEKLPEEDKKEYCDEPMVFLTNVRNEQEADIVKAVLDSSSIKVLKKHRQADDYINIYMGNTVLGVDIYVLESAYDVAKELIEIEQQDMEENNKELDEEEKDFEQLEAASNKQRSIAAWIILLFFIPGFLLLAIFLIFTIYNMLN